MRYEVKGSARIVVLLALLGGLTAGCSAGDITMDSPADGSLSDSAAVESRPADQQIIQTANVSLEVDDVEKAVSNVAESVDESDGFVQSRSINLYDNDATASMTIRIPASDLEGFLISLADEGRVLTSTIDAQDVTTEVIDLEARIRTLEASINRLRDLQQQAESVADLVAVESELATRQSELESLTARRDYLATQVDLATVYLWLDQRDTGSALTPDFIGGVQRGWDALLTLGAGLITGVGFLLPTALVGLSIAVVVIIIIRLIRRRSTREEQS